MLIMYESLLTTPGRTLMQAKDIMTSDVVTITPAATVEQIAQLLLERHISAAPVVDADNRVVGIVSEGDLLRRPEIGTERARSWWLQFMTSSREQASDYIKTHGLRAEEVMTTPAVTVEEDTPIGEIAQLLEKKRIKRVPVVQQGKLVGIVSRANLLHGLATHKDSLPQQTSIDDRKLRETILDTIRKQSWVMHGTPNVTVVDGNVELWGWVNSDKEKQAMELVVKNIPGVQSLESHLGSLPPYLAGA
jgi:CBS domain-containing protein